MRACVKIVSEKPSVPCICNAQRNKIKRILLNHTNVARCLTQGGVPVKCVLFGIGVRPTYRNCSAVRDLFSRSRFAPVSRPLKNDCSSLRAAGK